MTAQLLLDFDAAVDLHGMTGASARATREAVEKAREELVEEAAEELAETASQRLARQSALEEHDVVNGSWSDHVTTPRLRRDGSPDPAHTFPIEVENYAPLANHQQIPYRLEGGVHGGFEDLYQLPGSYNGRDGVFEWIVRDGEVMHRMFVPEGTPGSGPVGR